MPSWKNIPDRINAATAFAVLMSEDLVLREQCKKDSDLARKTFGEVGKIDDIPDDVVFRVFEENGPEIDKLVTLVLPDASVPKVDYPEYDVLRCTRPPH